MFVVPFTNLDINKLLFICMLFFSHQGAELWQYSFAQEGEKIGQYQSHVFAQQGAELWQYSFRCFLPNKGRNSGSTDHMFAQQGEELRQYSFGCSCPTRSRPLAIFMYMFEVHSLLL